jgi:NAD(P)-dependent dehydrogenase (short-subunit alcohol dehydrogenase family)
MKLEAGQVAVVTGGASGIGRGMADAFVRRGLVVVLADIELAQLDVAVKELTGGGATAVGVQVDVRDPEAMEALATRVVAELGQVDVLCNNAGVVTTRLPIWAQTAEDWRWIVDVNLLGVANGVRAFVPRMIEAGHGHVVNTSSIAGLSTIPGGGQGAYSATKHAVVGLSETLRIELDLVAPEIGVTVLCPGPVPSRIHDAARNRPMEPGVATEVAGLPKPDFALTLEPVGADVVGEQVAEAIESGLMYLLPGPGTAEMARNRLERVLADL